MTTQGSKSIDFRWQFVAYDRKGKILCSPFVKLTSSKPDNKARESNIMFTCFFGDEKSQKKFVDDVKFAIQNLDFAVLSLYDQNEIVETFDFDCAEGAIVDEDVSMRGKFEIRDIYAKIKYASVMKSILKESPPAQAK